MNAQSQGVVIDFTHGVENAPTLPPVPTNPILNTTSPSVNGVYFVRYNLASVSTRVLARNFNLSSGTSGSGLTSTFSAAQPTGTPSGFTGGSVSAPSQSLAPAGDGGNSSPASFFGLDFDLRWVYLAFTLAAFGMCIAPKFVLPARLPGLSKA
jgi:hypothetical protein